MTDRLDTIRKRLASGNPFTPHAGDLAWAVGEIERLTADVAEVDMILGIVGADREFRRVMLCTNHDRMKGLVADVERLAGERDEARSAVVLCAEFHQEREESIVAENKALKGENERLTRLAYPTLAVGADPTPVLTYYRAEPASTRCRERLRMTPEDVVPCVPCGRVECECGDARDEENCA